MTAASCRRSRRMRGDPRSCTTSCAAASSARRSGKRRMGRRKGDAMEHWNRRRFITTAAVAAGSGLAGWHAFGSRRLLAQAPLAGVPDEILNPVEVSGAEAVPVIGSLPGAKRMYVLPADAGEFHRVGSQVMKRIARPAETGDVHELATFTGNTGATMPRHAHLGSHAAVLIMRGEVEFELGSDRWTDRKS